MKDKALQMLQDRRHAILATIRPLELELVDIDNAIAKIEGKTTLDPLYDDEAPDSIKGTEDGI